MVVTDRKGPELRSAQPAMGPFNEDDFKFDYLTRPLPKLRYKVEGFHIIEDWSRL